MEIRDMFTCAYVHMERWDMCNKLSSKGIEKLVRL